MLLFVTSSGQEHKPVMARIVNCVFPETAIFTSSPRFSLALKMAIFSSAGQFEMSRCCRPVADSINCWKWRFVSCVEAILRPVSASNALRVMKQYNFPVPKRSSFSQSCSIRPYLLITLHHSKQVAAALAKSVRFRNLNTEAKMTEEISIFACSRSDLRQRCVRHKIFAPTIFGSDSFKKQFFLCFLSFMCENHSLYGLSFQ